MLFFTAAKDGLLKGLRTALTLLGIMIPVYLIVVLLRHTALFTWLADKAGSGMSVFGLPGEAVVPMIAGFFSDEYAVVAAMSGFPFSVAQITVISMITLCFHSIPVETAVTRKIGMSAWRIAVFRFGLAVLTGLFCAWLAAAIFGGFMPGTSVSLDVVSTASVSAAPSSTGLYSYVGIFDADSGQILPEMGWGALALIRNLLQVILPLMVVIEWMLVYHVVEALAKKLAPLCRLLGISQDALLPLLIGLFLGVTYGAGALAEMNRTKPLSPRDMTLLGVFLFSCHGIIETTWLFSVAGANAFFVSALRLGVAVGLTAVASRLIARRRRHEN